MVWMPTPADTETLAGRMTIAKAVREELAAAGLPLVPDDAGFDPSVAVGAHVYVDTLDDESGGGVFVEWKPHFVLRSAAMEALSEGREDDPSIRLAGTASSAMQDAMAEVLSMAGFTVTKDANDMAPFHLQVNDRTPRPSWRDWLDAQTARFQENLITTARTRPSAEQDPQLGHDDSA